MASDSEEAEFTTLLLNDLRATLLSTRPSIERLKMSFGDNRKYDEDFYLIEESVTSVAKALRRMIHFTEIDHLRAARWKKVDIKESIFLAIEKLSPLAKKKNVQIVFQSESASTNLVYGDKYLFSEFVFEVILENAIKFTKASSTVLVTLKKNFSRMIISFRDEGVGIDLNKLDDVYRLKKRSINPGFEGEMGGGLSLALSRRFLKKLKGEIIVSPLKEGGTEAVVKLYFA